MIVPHEYELYSLWHFVPLKRYKACLARNLVEDNSFKITPWFIAISTEYACKGCALICFVVAGNWITISTA